MTQETNPETNPGTDQESNPLFRHFERLYWIEFPLFIRDMVFDDDERKVLVFVDYNRKTTFPCSCGRQGLKIHDRIIREWRALDIGSYQTIIHLAVPRTKCPDCGVRQIKVGWSREHSHFTYLMEERILLLTQYMPLSNVARFLNVSERRVRKVLERFQGGARPPSRERAGPGPVPGIEAGADAKAGDPPPKGAGGRRRKD
ncbi:MAG: transposase family protein [Deltaproteobacteria bacterium]|jgi:hypothetical protein|nr:transposase family protein [Deltaproteobacteria bacterium]